MKKQNAFLNLAYWCSYILIYSFSLLPVRLLRCLSNITFWLVYNIIGYRREVVIQNISRAFPDKRYDEIQSISKKFYKCFISYFAEILKTISSSPTDLQKNIIFENFEVLEKYIHSGQNIIACLGHCGNWELLNLLSYKIDQEVYAVYKPLKSKVMNRLMIKIRGRFGMKLIADKSVAKHIQSKDTSTAIYLFLADQCPLIKDEKFSFSFLNQKTYFFSGMEKLARKSNSGVVYLNISQLSAGSYKIKFIPICFLAKFTDERKITQEYVRLLTENIKEQSHVWLWSHKRWKR
ncbi:lipid A biosynthesis acyltransferase [Flavobacterium sp. NST-5]|uniref:Lipid A biosynthesis acyltransferase n=1 Tax=Flavobacterium ichthyis TaxID=2698827 RepID=A0ABW9ZA47_9FLAO|nr:lysophospholipid acyltransferase family protein [Flavobacterium ichthyis]NBL65589.1 lipid A biosynthesis acyltransferase [Flavobacterium ichthyis]